MRRSGVQSAVITPIRGVATAQRFSMSEAARILEVPLSRLRAYARAGSVAPERGPHGQLAFSFQDLLLLRTTKGLVDSGVPPKRIRRIWSSLRRQLEGGLPLTSITIYADGERVIAWDGDARWQPDSGQFLLNFDASEIAGSAAEVPPPIEAPRPRPTLVEVAPPASTPEPATLEGSFSAGQWFDLGCELERSSPAEARQAFEQALALDPDFADAHVNLGRLHHLARELGRAEVEYREAVRLAPEDPTAHFNLGVLLEDRSMREEAVFAYRQAIARDPEHADAHYNLGLLLESLGRTQEAVQHLMAARKLYRTQPE